MYTTLSPCDMCTGACLLYKIKRVVIGENQNFVGGEKTLKERGVELVVLQDEECIELMANFIKKRPELWCVAMDPNDPPLMSIGMRILAIEFLQEVVDTRRTSCKNHPKASGLTKGVIPMLVSDNSEGQNSIYHARDLLSILSYRPRILPPSPRPPW